VSKADIGRLRSRGLGIWKIVLIVLGFDETFVFQLPGNLSEHFAKKVAIQTLASKLRVKRKNIEIQSCDFEDTKDHA
jgi:hypothetical protein